MLHHFMTHHFMTTDVMKSRRLHAARWGRSPFWVFCLQSLVLIQLGQIQLGQIQLGQAPCWGQPPAEIDAAQRLEPEMPPYFVEGLSIVQTAPAGEHARFELTGTVRLTDASADSERIPLFLGKCALLKSSFEGEGQHAVAEDKSGYELWISGQPNSKHDFVLTFARKLLRLGRARRLELQLPDRTVPIQLWLDEQNPRIILDDDRTITEGAGPGERAGTWKLSLVSLGGDFRIQWHPADEAQGNQRTDFTAVGDIDFRFLDPRQLAATAKISVTSELRGFGSFSVRLPPRFTLVETDQPEFGVVVLERGTTRRGPLIRVDVFEAGETAEVELQARLTRPFARAIQLAGFSVEGATFQANRLSVRFPAQWSLHTPESLNARRVDREGVVDTEREGMAHFDVFHQPGEAASLQVELRERQARIVVQPTYRLTVDGTRVTMEAKMRFDVRGILPKELDIWTGQWKLSSVDSTVAPGIELASPNVNVQIVPIERTDIATAPFDVNLRGEIAISTLPDQTQLSLPDPRPDIPLQGQSVVMSPPRLILVVASGLDVIPQLKDPAFSFDEPPQEWAFSTSDPPEGFRQSFFQFETNIVPTLSLNISERPQAFVGMVRADVDVSPSRVDVTQTIDLEVLNQPLGAIPLVLPTAATDIQVSVGGQSQVVGDWPPDGVEGDAVDRTISLSGSPRFGQLKIVITYTLPGIRRNTETISSVIPLVSWQDWDSWERVETRLNITDSLSREMNLTETAWTYVLGTAADVVEASTQGAVAEVLVDIAASAAQSRRADVAKTWVQTIIAGGRRIDHYSVRVRPVDEIQVRLPEGVVFTLDAVLVAIDGREVANIRLNGDREVQVPITSSDIGRLVLMEVWYRFPDVVANGTMELSFAEIVDARSVGRTYLELVTDRNRHLLLPPSTCFSENEWIRNTVGWRRKPLLSTADLRQWIEMSGRESELTGANRYLYSSIGSINRVRIQVCSRTLLVLLSSLAALVFGVAVAYVRAARHPLSLAAVGTLIVALVVRWPSTGVLVVQAAFLGLLLVAVCLALRWWYLPVRPRIMGATEDIRPLPDGELSTKSLEHSRSHGSGSQTLAGSRS